MSNAYCTIDQLFAFYDKRTMSQLSGDLSANTADSTKLQTLLDAAASELETALTGWFGLPLASVPAVLTKWVAVKCACYLWARRTDRPRGLDPDAEWCDKFIGDLRMGIANLPGITRAAAKLVSSDSLTGKSRFDNLTYYGGATQTGASKGQVWDGGQT